MGLTENPSPSKALHPYVLAVHILLQAKFAQFKIDQQKSTSFTLIFIFIHVSEESIDEPNPD